MATPTRPSVQHSSGNAERVNRAVADELRTILEHRDEPRGQSPVTEFLARHRLTDHDINALLSYLVQEDAIGGSTDSEDALTLNAPSAGKHSTAMSAFVQATDTSADSSEPASIIETDTFDGDLAWMFGEEPESPVQRAADDIVGRAFDDLLGDWHRTGGQLTRGEVALLAAKRGLSPLQHSELLDLLEEAGVDLPAPSEVRPTWSTKNSKPQEDGVGQYLRAIARYPLIDASREVELWSLISQGCAAQEELDAAGEDAISPNLRLNLQDQALAGRRAHSELVCANLRLVVSVAKARQYESGGVEFADRIQDGNLGLMRAADKFDGSKGFKFSTYATHWIRQAIERGIGNTGRTIRIPVHAHEQVQKVRRAVTKLSARFDRDPSLAELADLTGMETGKLQWALDVMRPFRSLDEPIGDEGDLRLSDILVGDDERDGRSDPAEIIIHAMFRADVERVLGTLLPERTASIIERRFGIGTGDRETLDAIGADYGVTRERIRQIQSKALTQLRESDQAPALRSYLVDDDSETNRPGGSVDVERKAS